MSRRIAIAIVVIVLASPAAPVSAGTGAQDAAFGSVPASVSPRDPREGARLAAPTDFGLVDDFQRVVADGWGTSPGGVTWVDDTFREEGRTSADLGNHASVDGANARVTTGIQGDMWQMATVGPWQHPAWTMTGEFQVDWVPSVANQFDDLYFWIFKDRPEAYADAQMLHFMIGNDAIGPVTSGISLGGTVGNGKKTGVKTDWAPNTLYRFRWTVVWGGVASAKVWVAGSPEPYEWLVSRDATADTFRNGDNTVLEVVSGAAPLSVNYTIGDIAVIALPVPACPGNFSEFALPDATGATSQVEIRYDARLLVDQHLPNAGAVAAKIADQVWQRALGSVAWYQALGFTGFAPHIVVELTCRSGPQGVIHVAPGFTENDHLLRLDVGLVAADFAPNAEVWLHNPSAVLAAPHAGWATTLDHELFHTVQWAEAGGGIDGADLYKLADDATITESSATLAQDLFPDWDDDRTSAANGVGYRDRVLAFLRGPVSADQPYDFFHPDDKPYRTAPAYQYFGERFGPQNEPDLERRVAAFLDVLTRAPGSHLRRLGNALGYNYGTSTFSRFVDPVAAIRDFYIAAYAIHGVSTGGFLQYRLKDNTTGSDGGAIASQYPDPIALVSGPLATANGTFSVEHATGQIHEVTALAGVARVHVKLTVLPHHALTSDFELGKLRVAIFRVDANNGGLLFTGHDTFVTEWDGVTARDYDTSGMSKLVVVAMAGTENIPYELEFTGRPAPVSDITVVTPTAAAPATGGPEKPIAVKMQPTIDGQLVPVLGSQDVQFSIDGVVAFRLGKPVLGTDAWTQTITPLVPLSAGTHSLTVTFSGITKTVNNVIQITGAAGQASLHATTVPSSLGSAGTPLKIAVSLLSAGTDPDGATPGGAVLATVNPPAGSSRTVWLFDDGAHGDGEADDGVYAATTWDTPVPGSYAIHVAATYGSDSASSDTAVSLSGLIDLDGDGVSDLIEPSLGLNPSDSTDGQLDPDRDGVGVASELASGTNPLAWDSDGGGESDASETAHGGNIDDPSDDASLPVARISVQHADGNLITVMVATGDGTGTVDVYRVSDGANVILGTYPGAGATFTDAPAPGISYTYGAVVRLNSASAGPQWAEPIVPVADATTPDLQLIANSGDRYTRNPSVGLSVIASGDATQMRLAADATDIEAQPWVPFTSAANLGIAAVDGGHFVFAQVRDAAANESEVASTYVVLDRVNPTSSMGGLPATTQSRVLALQISSSDAAAGVLLTELWSRYRARAADPWAAWTHATDFSGASPHYEVSQDGLYEFYTVAVDRAGNREAAPGTADAAVTVDTAAPSSSISPIAPTYTSSSVALAIVSSDATSGVPTVDVLRRYRATPTGTWTTWAQAGTTSTATFNYTFGNGYGYYEFYSIAHDGAGNTETAPAVADANTQYVPAVSWGAATRLSATGAAVNGNAVALGSDGSANAAWEQGPFLSYDIYTSRFDPTSGAWSAPIKLNSDTGTLDQTSPSIAVGSNGTIVAVWRDNRVDSKGDVYAARRTGTSWGPNLKVTDDTKTSIQAGPVVAVDGTGKAIAVWEDSRSNQKKIMSSTLAAGSSTWSANIVVAANSTPYKRPRDVAIAPDGTVYAAWYTDPSGTLTSMDIWIAKLPPGASTWSAPVKVNDLGPEAGVPEASISVDSAGVVFVAWEHQVTTTDTHDDLRLSRSSNGGTTWGASTLVAARASSPSFARDPSGTLHLAYSGSGVQLTRWLPATATWAPPETASDAGAVVPGPPSLGANNTRFVVIWTDRRNSSSGEMFARVGARN